MANSHVIQQILLCLYSSLTLVLVFTSFDKLTTVANAAKISLPLIHRNSKFSPFYKSKLSFPPDDIRSPLIPESGYFIFLVNVSIGEPPVPQLLGLDSGSDLIWLGPTYDPKRSSTYSTISCSSKQECSDYYNSSNCETEQCSYYLDSIQGHTSGILATEKFTFETSSDGIVQVPNVAFGFSLDTNWQSNGHFGLKPIENHSLTSVLGKKFSYCLGNLSDFSYMYNQLILGDGAIMEGPSTPLQSREDNFFVNFNGISIGGEALEIDEKEFGYNTVIDCGSEYTGISEGVYHPLRRKIMDLMEGLRNVVAGSKADELCFWGNIARDLKGFPVVTLHFAEGVDLDLGVDALFYRRSSDVFCLAVGPAEEDHNVVGVLAQQFYNVGFDMNAMQLSLQYIDCSLLED